MSNTRNISNLALIGFMGTGKSAVGRLLAEQLHFEFVDTDDLIVNATGKSIADIFEQQGEAVFRELEHHIIKELTLRTQSVISTGGGVPVNPDNLASLKSHSLVVCLWASPERIWENVQGQSHRPLLLNVPDPLAKIRELLSVRAPFYKQADVLVNTEWRSVREVAQQVAHQFQSAVSAYK